MTDEDYKLFREGHSHCPRYTQGKQSNFRCVCRGLMHDEIGHSCFMFCDVESKNKCGDCVNWVGDETDGTKRHDKFGHCFFRVEGVGAWFPTCCPHFHKREDDTNYVDWCEEQVYNELGRNDSSMECREARIRARQKWAKKYK